MKVYVILAPAGDGGPGYPVAVRLTASDARGYVADECDGDPRYEIEEFDMPLTPFRPDSSLRQNSSPKTDYVVINNG